MYIKTGAIIAPFIHFEHVKVAVDHAYVEVVGHEAMLTSGTDGRHSTRSLHYKMHAWDFRTRKKNSITNDFYGEDTLQVLASRISSYLGAFYDVVIEATHIHVEFDPKVID